MPDESVKELALLRLKERLEAIEDIEVGRNVAVPEKLRLGRYVAIADGEAEEIDPLLGNEGPFAYVHEISLELSVQASKATDRDAMYDRLERDVGAALDADLTLGGVVESMVRRPSAPPDIDGVAGAPEMKSGIMVVVVEYQSASRV
ncbi:MAG: hypothetical protein MI920_02005 [Kiloniellales bacterium]|nr:hypothetical protein [Kiloniellales bacterium]